MHARPYLSTELLLGAARPGTAVHAPRFQRNPEEDARAGAPSAARPHVGPSSARSMASLCRPAGSSRARFPSPASVSGAPWCQYSVFRLASVWSRRPPKAPADHMCHLLRARHVYGSVVLLSKCLPSTPADAKYTSTNLQWKTSSTGIQAELSSEWASVWPGYAQHIC